MSVCSYYNDDGSVDNCYNDDDSAVSSTHSPPHSPSSYELDDHPEHELIEHQALELLNPPPASTNLNFYGETSVNFNSRPPALIKFLSDTGNADCQIQDYIHDSGDSVQSLNNLPDAVKNNDSANDTADKITGEENKNNSEVNCVSISNTTI